MKPARYSFRRVFLVVLGLFVAVGVLWAFATPLDGAPDERVQLIKAASVVRGEWLGATVPGIPAETRVNVPDAYAKIGIGDCVVGKPDESEARCPPLATTSQIVSATTYVGHYPPLYYLLVGCPSFIGTRWSIWLVRLLSVFWNGAFLALAVAAVHRWSRSMLLMAALAVAVTPMAVFLSSVVNPSGLEITAGITMWTSAVLCVTGGPKHPPPVPLLAILTLSTCVEILVRGNSFLWVLACAVVVTPMAFRRLRIGSEAARFLRWVSLPATAASIVAAAVWMFVGHPLTVYPLGVPAPGTPELELVREVVGAGRMILLQMIGSFGWVDTPAPWITYLVWSAIFFALLAMVVVVGRRRHLLSVGLAVLAAGGLPVILLLASIRTSGSLFQGRYFLALMVGVPIVAGSVSTQSGLPRGPAARVARCIFVLAALGQVSAGWWALHRYLVGADGPLSPFVSGPGVWRPPLPAWVTDLGFVVVWGAFLLLAVRYVDSFAPAPTSGPRRADLVAGR